jgi:hypothetical protein
MGMRLRKILRFSNGNRSLRNSSDNNMLSTKALNRRVLTLDSYLESRTAAKQGARGFRGSALRRVNDSKKNFQTEAASATVASFRDSANKD